MQPARFEGGQMALTQRIPKLRGFRGPSGDRWAAVTLAQLERFGNTTVSLAELQKAGIVPRHARYLKVIGTAKPSRKLSVTADRASAGAAKAIVAAGGKLTLPKPSESDKPREG